MRTWVLQLAGIDGNALPLLRAIAIRGAATALHAIPVRKIIDQRNAIALDKVLVQVRLSRGSEHRRDRKSLVKVVDNRRLRPDIFNKAQVAGAQCERKDVAWQIHPVAQGLQQLNQTLFPPGPHLGPGPSMFRIEFTNPHTVLSVGDSAPGSGWSRR
jgi:hypothetical protein